MGKKEIINQLSDLKKNISDGTIGPDEALDSLNEYKTQIRNEIPGNNEITGYVEKVFLEFNKSNFSDITILIMKENGHSVIVEAVGDQNLLNNIIFRLNHGKDFYKTYDSIKYNSIIYRSYHETMNINDREYSLVCFSESKFFKASKFHMLSDILMEYIRLTETVEKPYFNDFFEDSAVQINSFLHKNEAVIRSIYIFKFDHNTFLHETGLNTAIEFSESIENKLKSFFKNRSGIFKLSLTLFIVIVVSENSMEKGNEEYNMEEKENLKIDSSLNFIFNDIILVYTFTKIPYSDIKTSYDIFEKLYSITLHQ